MRKFVCSALLSALVGCAHISPSSPVLTPSQALEQYAGATAALSNLTSALPITGPTAASVQTIQQIEGYAAWAGVALKAAGIVATVVGL